jgi:hypothetical protein
MISKGVFWHKPWFDYISGYVMEGGLQVEYKQSYVFSEITKA